MAEALNSNGVFASIIWSMICFYISSVYINIKKHLNYSSLPYQMSGSNLYGCSVNCNRFFHLQTMFTSLPVCLLGRNFWLVYYLSSSFYCVSLHFFEESIIKEMKYSQCTYIFSLLQISRRKKKVMAFLRRFALTVSFVYGIPISLKLCWGPPTRIMC